MFSEDAAAAGTKKEREPAARALTERATMKNRSHLPVLGPGPFYVGLLLLSAAGIFIADQNGRIPRFCLPSLPLLFSACGGVLIAGGSALYYGAVVKQRIDRSIKKNELVTGGVYAYVRNPIYTAFLFLYTGVLLQLHNLYVLLFPIFFWAFLTLLLRATEERWLRSLYGEKYNAYCRRVNRVIPWFPRQGKSGQDDGLSSGATREGEGDGGA